MKIAEIISYLETIAPAGYQEHYDNAGLVIGDRSWECSGVLVSLDATELIIKEAVANKCNLIIAHHPIIFGGLKKINGKNYVEKAVITAIKNDVAIYAIHTNLDNVKEGVNGKIAKVLGLQNCNIILPRENTLQKLFTFVPVDHAEQVRQAIFNAGGGNIGNYSACSFNTDGTGTFKAGETAQPYAGEIGQLHREKEVKIEVIFPAYLGAAVIAAMKQAHPYEEVAYDVVSLSNIYQAIGAGIIGELPGAVSENEFLELVKRTFKVPFIKHTQLLGKPVKTVAVCGGAGSFLISRALAAGADFYITSDVKYHEFFDAEGGIVIADIGHFESEQYTIDLIHEILEQKFPNFAVLKTGVVTNPVFYFG